MAFSKPPPRPQPNLAGAPPAPRAATAAVHVAEQAAPAFTDPDADTVIMSREELRAELARALAGRPVPAPKRPVKPAAAMRGLWDRVDPTVAAVAIVAVCAMIAILAVVLITTGLLR